jgi:hypothetical protein
VIAVRKRGLLAGGLVAITGAVGFAAVLGVQTPTPARAAVAHRCGVGDRDFIAKAQIDIDGLGLWAQEYQQGDVTAEGVFRQSRDAAERMRQAAPQDPALRTTRALLVSMFIEYGKAVRARARGRDAGPFMVRAYGLANSAHDVLEQSTPELRSMGCDLTPLL